MGLAQRLRRDTWLLRREVRPPPRRPLMTRPPSENPPLPLADRSRRSTARAITYGVRFGLTGRLDPVGFAGAQLRARVLERDGHHCQRCHATEHLQMDHVWPWSLGGPTGFSNLQTLCRRCNAIKGAFFGDFRPRRRRVSERAGIRVRGRAGTEDAAAVGIWR